MKPVVIEKVVNAGEIDRKIAPGKAAALAANNLKTFLRRRFHTVVVVGGMPASGKSTLIWNVLEQDPSILFFEGLLYSPGKRVDFLNVFRPLCRAKLIWLDVPKDISIQRNLVEGRGAPWTNEEVESAWKIYEPPTPFEGWYDFMPLDGTKPIEELVEKVLGFCDKF